VEEAIVSSYSQPYLSYAAAKGFGPSVAPFIAKTLHLNRLP